MAKILTKREPTGAGDEPTNLEFGELAVNTVDGKLWVGNAATDPVLIATKGGALIDVNAPAHGFQTLDCVYFDGVSWQKAQANAEDTVALGVVVSVVDVDNFSYAFSGRFEIPGNTLLDDEWYYLSDTVAGELTATEPAGISQPLVYSETGDFVSIYPYRPAVSPTGALALPPGTGDGNTLRWEADTQQWQQQSNLVIADDGNVGVGTATPRVNLHVSTGDSGLASVAGRTLFLVESSTNGAGMEFASPAAQGFQQIAFSDEVSGGGRIRYDHTDDHMSLWTSQNERMRITSAGNMGISTTTPSDRLTVWGRTLLYDTTNTTAYPVECGLRFINGRNFNAGGTFNQAWFGANIDTTTDAVSNLPQVAANTGGFTCASAIGLGSNNAGVIMFATAPNGSPVGTDLTERMRIDEDGNVGIGTATPDAVANTKLTVASHFLVGGADSSVGNPLLRIQAVDAVSQGDMSLQVLGGGLRFYDNVDVAERIRIDTNGNLLVGVTAGKGSERMSVVSNGVVSTFVCGAAAGGSPITEYYSASVNRVAYIDRSGNFVGPVSDESLKENIKDYAGSALDKVNAVRVVSFDWKESGEHVPVGFIAQELASAIPEAVTSDNMRKDAHMVPMLVKAIQELTARVKELEA